MTVSDAESVLLAIARLEGKVDAALATQGAQLAEHGRRLDEHDRRSEDRDARLRAVENRPTVSPRAALAGAAAVAAIVAAATPFLDRLYQ